MNNPVNFIDPRGLSAQALCTGGGGGSNIHGPTLPPLPTHIAPPRAPAQQRPNNQVPVSASVNANQLATVGNVTNTAVANTVENAGFVTAGICRAYFNTPECATVSNFFSGFLTGAIDFTDGILLAILNPVQTAYNIGQTAYALYQMGPHGIAREVIWAPLTIINTYYDAWVSEGAYGAGRQLGYDVSAAGMAYLTGRVAYGYRGGAGATATAQVPRNTNVGWRVGQPIDNLTAAGNTPSWNTVKQRYWKNEAFNNPGAYSTNNLARMQQGLAPLHPTYNVPMELHHVGGRNIPNPHALNNLQPVWPWEHAAIDPYRFYTGPGP